MHELVKQFVPLPENVIPQTEWFSEYQRDLMESTNSHSKCNKLVAHLFEHKNYVIHYRLLEFVVELGVKLGVVHNILSFKQKRFLEPYITGNTDLRKQSKNEFEKVFF